MKINTRSLWSIIASIILYLLLIALFGYLVYDHGPNILAQFKNLQWHHTLLIVLLQLPIIGLGGLAFHLLAHLFNIKQHWHDWIGLSFIANFMNQLLPYRPGMIFRCAYLRHHYHMTINQFISTTVILLFQLILIASLMTTVGWLWGDFLSDYQIFPMIFSALFILLCMAIFLLNRHQQRQALLPEKTQRLADLWRTIKGNPLLIVGSACCVFLVYLCSALSFYLIFMALQMPIPFTYAIFMSGVLGLAMIFPVTPGNIGVLEALSGMLTLNFYQDFSLGFSVCTLFRVAQWIPSLLLGTGFSLLLVGKLLPAKRDYGA